MPVRLSDFMTVQQIADVMKWEKRTVYNRASREGWRKLPTRPVMYYVHDIVHGSGNDQNRDAA